MAGNNIQRDFDLLIAKMGEILSKGVNVPHYKEDCYWYGEWQDMNARIPYCKCKKHPADTIGPNDCESCKQYHNKDKPSKADRIRAMSDEELARWIADDLIEPGYYVGDNCYKVWLKWLKEEVKDA